MKVQFKALVKNVNRKALVSGDTSYECKLQGEDPNMAQLVTAPSNDHIKITIEWGDNA